MCGIAGFYQTKTDYTATTESHGKWLHILNKMKESLRRRGPDEEGICLYPHAGLAHTRLSVIDLGHGQQPLKKSRDGKECTIIYNGEIYNTKELRKLLSGYPVEFSTTSDTEVILNGYLSMGPAFFSELNGIFAFAIYDGRKDCLYLVRDRLGVKPLFYQKQEETLCFGSEPKALFAYGITPRINQESLCEVLMLGPAHTPGHGVFAGMKELLPGHYLEICPNHIKDHCYWKLTAAPHTDSYEATVEKTSWLIQDSIRRQMVSDIPICTFLSGGLDSSLVSAFCSRELEKQGKTLDTYSFDFVGNDKNFIPNSFQSTSDAPFATLMAEHLHTRHTRLTCDNLTQADYLYKAVDVRDMPCMADVESSLLYFCSQVSLHHRVALTGECADEIFGGYPWFHREEMWKQTLFPWSYDLTPRLCLLREDFIRSTDLTGYVQNAYDRSLAETPRLPGEDKKEARRREISWLNIRWFMATLLNRMDRTSMYSGLEARVPFADHRILQYVYNIPWHMKCHQGQTKSLLIEAGKELLPPQVLNRKKSPYPKTYDPEYDRILNNRLRQVLSGDSSPLLRFLDPVKAEAFLNTPADYGTPWYGQLMAHTQMTAYLLQIHYWMVKYDL